MKHILPLFLLIPMLFVGCATTAHPKSYEYRFVHGSKFVEDLQLEVNELAKEGWRVNSFALGDNGRYKYFMLERLRKE